MQARELLPPEELEQLHRARADEREGHVNWGKLLGGKKSSHEISGDSAEPCNGPGALGETFEFLGRCMVLGRWVLWPGAGLASHQGTDRREKLRASEQRRVSGS